MSVRNAIQIYFNETFLSLFDDVANVYLNNLVYFIWISLFKVCLQGQFSGQNTGVAIIPLPVSHY